MRRKLLGCAIVVLVLGVAGAIGLHRVAGPFYYSADDVQGTVVDGVTQEPIAGALVIGQWQLETLGGNQGGLLHSAETITDSHGRYRLQGFLRKRRPFLEWLEVQDPWIIVYKPGYACGNVTNRDDYYLGEYSHAAKRSCAWNGKSIPLQRTPPVETTAAASDFKFILRDERRFPLARAYLAPPATPVPLTAPVVPYQPGFYTSDPIHGAIVDMDGTPVPGAVVAAVWRLVDNPTGRWRGVFVARETFSDARGQFVIPTWGPRPTPAETSIDPRGPELWVIKRGFVVAYFDRTGAYECLPSADRTARPPTGQALRIRRARNDAELARSLEVANPRDPNFAQTPFRMYFEEWRQSVAHLPFADRPAFPPRNL